MITSTYIQCLWGIRTLLWQVVAHLSEKMGLLSLGLLCFLLSTVSYGVIEFEFGMFFVRARLFYA